MIDPAFLGLIQNAALLLAMAFIYDVMTSRYRFGVSPPLMQVGIGALLGILGGILILTPWTYVPGVVFDTRSVLLSISGLFFGVIPTGIAMIITSALRLSLGGAAAWTGVAVILATGSLGILWRHLRRHPLTEISWQQFYLFGLLVHLVMLALMFILPWDTALRVLSQISLPVLLIYPLATTLLGILMVNRLGREDFSTQLQVSEERLRLALMAANQGLYDLNVQTGEAKISPEYATMLGYDPVGFQLTVNKWIERMHPDDREPVAMAYRDYIAGKIPEYRVEFRQRTKAGDWKWILSLGKVVEYDNAGRPLRMIGTHTDITERKQAEEALRENEIFIRTVLDNLPIGIAVNAVAPAVEFLYMNDNFPKFYHTTREALATSDAFWEAAYEDPIFGKPSGSK
ncbi:LytS/YhcK type 5TM receptor domain-containing protein [Thiovibrio frasassiensis]|uniref:histidine kinase n=1 Tax=Thiovibrio frasassiensis TaxID=2984131 RepID=A0A9X4ME54_9BACT|nr:LytS/YhcK type 5TM receptor domain-containing protein [Thiovibrio frasassiensis]MDG4475636.1 PAS domain-containing protein [Thiovibrio frasassiensis]